ncbi:hypothetical protein KP509_06G006800 [Ceratopteris richardii]|uniref:Pentatricopeptide repeat-containing protein n=1 Tax=Ceratopteris richardii TaxID=49495 RepID=A0A8T2UL58_CERRI|nr:hypothetical protein KP509_06G006800 [Ceratopteris richardii]
MDMYAKCGEPARAQEVFDELSKPDILAWNILVDLYSHQELNEKALNCIGRMKIDGISPDAVTFSCILKVSGAVTDVVSGKKVHSDIIKLGFLENNTILGNTLLDMYIKCGAYEEAMEVFNALPFRDVVSWNTLISGCFERGNDEYALECFDRMQHEGLYPDVVTFTYILKACGRVNAAYRGAEIHVEMVRNKMLEGCSVLGSALLDMYIKCGFLIKAQEVFDRLNVRNEVLWNSLIVGYGAHGHGEVGFQCFKRMQLEGFFSNSVTFIGALKTCSNMAVPSKGHEVHAMLEIQGLVQKDLLVGSTLMDMYAKCGEPARAQEVFDELSKPDILAWNILVDLYSHQELNEKALNCIGRMKIDGISPDAVTFSCILKVSGAVTDVVSGKKVHSDIIKLGFLENNTILGNTLLDMYIKCGAYEEAMEVFNALPFRDVVSWNTLISGCFERGNDEYALECFDRMQHEGLYPDVVTFTYILKACGRVNAAYRGAEIHVEMVRNKMLEGCSVLGSALLDMYIKCGALARAQSVFDDLKFGDVVLWISLMAGVEDKKVVEAGFLESDRFIGSVLLDMIC